MRKFISVIPLLLVSGVALATKSQAPIQAHLKFQELPQVGTPGKLVWSGTPQITPKSSALRFFVRKVDQDGFPLDRTAPMRPFQELNLNLQANEAAHATAEIRIEEPGFYQVFTGVTLLVDGGQFAKEEMIFFELPARGKAKILKEKVLSAEDLMDREQRRREQKKNTASPQPRPQAQP